MKDNNYIVVQGWMLNQLHLKGNELLVFATIHGFSQDDNSTYEGSYQYLADWCGIEKRSVIRVVNSLIDKNLIIKKELIINNCMINQYCTNVTPSDKMSPPTSDKMSPNNNRIDNNKENSIINTIKEKFVKPTLEQLKEYINSNNYHFNAEDFINHYESVGWMIGNKKMKSWQACCRTWESNWKKKNPNYDEKVINEYSYERY